MSRPCPSPFPRFIWGLFWGTAQSPALEGAQERPCFVSLWEKQRLLFSAPPWLPGPRSQSQIGGAWLPSYMEGISRLEPQVLTEGS